MANAVAWFVVLMVLQVGLHVVVALCPINCTCYIFRNMHMANCRDRDIRTADVKRESFMKLSRHQCFALLQKYLNEMTSTDLASLPIRGSDMYAYLELSDNKLKGTLHGDSFTEFPIVQVLNLSQNAFSELTQHVFRGLQYLTQLDLSHNSIRLRHSLHVNFINEHRVTWLSLAGNQEIGKELAREDSTKLQMEDDRNVTAWFYSDSLKVLSLANCGLARLPRWMVRGLPGITSLDVSNNQLKVLPMMTLVTICRLKTIGLGSNKWICPNCANVRANHYFEERTISTLYNYTFCPDSKKLESHCDIDLTLDEELERSLCNNKSVSEALVYEEPHSFWFYVAVIAGCIIGLVFLSLLGNAVFSSLCKKKNKNNSKTSPKPRASSVVRDQELLQVLPHPHSNLYQ